MADRRERARRARRRQESLSVAPAGSTFRAAAARERFNGAALSESVKGRAKPAPSMLSLHQVAHTPPAVEVSRTQAPRPERKREIPPPATSGLRIAEVRQCKARPNPRRDGARGGGTGRPFVPWCR